MKIENLDTSVYFPNLAELLPEVPHDGILSRAFLKNEYVNVTLFGFDAGQELSEHTSSRPAILHVLQGEADLTLGDKHLHAGAGAWAFMPSNLPHSLVAKTPLIVLLILVQPQS
jgi:quercetin dioxygenase-like cupin family protein